MMRNVWRYYVFIHKFRVSSDLRLEIPCGFWLSRTKSACYSLFSSASEELVIELAARDVNQMHVRTAKNCEIF
jgi:hypothetical protein